MGTDWPDVANPNWDDQVTLFWRERGIDPGFDVTEASNTILRASELLQFPVADMGSGAGTVVDLLIALGENRAKYMILAQGTGTADSPRVAAPFSAFDPMAFGDEFVFDPNLDPAVMRSAPRFDPTLFPGPGHIDSAALDEFDLYWEQQGYPVRVRETQ
ncbi:MAG: hypothetical protein DCC55_28800 [Chloroflexi bacterium]|nr:MAG: hypothetical protein DCC55_28800 [Chloroflexota bacterium]